MAVARARAQAGSFVGREEELSGSRPSVHNARAVGATALYVLYYLPDDATLIREGLDECALLSRPSTSTERREVARCSSRLSELFW
jgi:hypothetical protein